MDKNRTQQDCGLLQDIASAYPALLRALTAACQNDYNCKVAAKQGAAGLAAGLLSSSSSETVFEAVCLLYTLTTQAEARLAVGQALFKTAGAEERPAVGQLLVLLASPNPGQCASTSMSFYHRVGGASLMRYVWGLEVTHCIWASQTQTHKYPPRHSNQSPFAILPTLLLILNRMLKCSLKENSSFSQRSLSSTEADLLSKLLHAEWCRHTGHGPLLTGQHRHPPCSAASCQHKRQCRWAASCGHSH